ncbi:MAG: DUF4296 domain-containing protein [Ginsengibacter sp.]
MKNAIYIIFFSCLVSCNPNSEAPSNILQPPEMSNILWDIMRSQTLAYEIARKDSTVNEAIETKALSQKVFSIYKIDSAYFNKSYNWYVRHPAILKTIFDSMYVQKESENNLKLDRKNMLDTLSDPGFFKKKWYNE